MGLRIDLTHANWLAYVVEPQASIPALDYDYEEREALSRFLGSLSQGYRSSAPRMVDFAIRMEYLSHRLMVEDSPRPMHLALQELRQFFTQRPWTALLVPSAQPSESDGLLTDPQFLQKLVDPAPEDPGLILQLEEPRPYDNSPLQLFEVFPAFRSALTNVTSWPGVLLWTSQLNSAFFPFGKTGLECIRERCVWLFRRLYETIGHSLPRLQEEYVRTFPEVAETVQGVCHLLQVSDIHIGSREAGTRLERLQQLIRNLVHELGDGENIIPIISGDMVDTPDQKLMPQARRFWESFDDLRIGRPFFIVGNHDVRGRGFMGADSRLTRYISPDKVEQYEDQRVTLVGFDSCEEGELGAGRISEDQFLDRGKRLDRMDKDSTGILVGVVHHHPLPVEHPDWERIRFYQRWFGRYHEPTVAFENATLFMQFAAQRRFAAVLHGHKHIPRICQCPTTLLPVWGCGSSIGKIETRDGSIRMSVNLISINRSTGLMSCRLLMETVPGGGLANTQDQVITVSRTP